MINFLKKTKVRLPGNEKGFTLAEMLVVIGIIAALAAASVPFVARFAGSGQTGSQTLELQNMQAAFDSLMSDAAISAVDANTAATDASVQTWTGLPQAGAAAITVGGVAVDLADYMRLTADATNFFYCWDATGLVDEQLTAAGNCS
ncbi:MAG: prepilin-type N-terminal cleavage/methylation domain-containing protein [SAR202 cluster bacterium]|jgi:prepilin-type N-terminal cleavage/methylation domain-containing protein|nr:prepilin-type N-terminal cleavage/methylation domain-containing protein [SAR202 cluster bacterium]MDP6513786.1 prepilin-type N-terminal cleavage/methylation domain-containing protein [SAR202 cluster bacterium]MDP6713345.1 prepilin-type N-terminal cleavage/methylation domain-containing protein [SAR202 cluster bacterium]